MDGEGQQVPTVRGYFFALIVKIPAAGVISLPVLVGLLLGFIYFSSTISGKGGINFYSPAAQP